MDCSEKVDLTEIFLQNFREINGARFAEWFMMVSRKIDILISRNFSLFLHNVGFFEISSVK